MPACVLLGLLATLGLYHQSVSRALYRFEGFALVSSVSWNSDGAFVIQDLGAHSLLVTSLPGLKEALLVPTDGPLSSDQIRFQGDVQSNGTVRISEFRDPVSWNITTAIAPSLYEKAHLVPE